MFDPTQDAGHLDYRLAIRSPIWTIGDTALWDEVLDRLRGNDYQVLPIDVMAFCLTSGWTSPSVRISRDITGAVRRRSRQPIRVRLATAGTGGGLPVRSDLAVESTNARTDSTYGPEQAEEATLKCL